VKLSVINFACTYKRLDTFLTCGNHGNHLYDCIISLKEVLWAHQTSLTPSLVIVMIAILTQLLGKESGTSS
jgi:hypothetical protein